MYLDEVKEANIYSFLFPLLAAFLSTLSPNLSEGKGKLNINSQSFKSHLHFFPSITMIHACVSCTVFEKPILLPRYLMKSRRNRDVLGLRGDLLIFK